MSRQTPKKVTTIPQDDSSGVDKVITTDQDVDSLLYKILTELKIMNLHLSFLTDNNINKTEVG